MIISIDAEKAINKIQHSLIIKLSRKWADRRNKASGGDGILAG